MQELTFNHEGGKVKGRILDCVIKDGDTHYIIKTNKGKVFLKSAADIVDWKESEDYPSFLDEHDFILPQN